MSHKDNLLAGARTCLLTRGYRATTVRDLVEASGANQASINYHFGSKEALLNLALFDLNREWGSLLFAALAGPESSDSASGPPSAQQAQERWARVIDSIQNNRELWFVNFESIPYVQHDETIRAMNAQGQEASRVVLAEAFAGLTADGPEEEDEVHALGSHYYSLLVGVALQWLTDPERAPSAADVVRADRGRSDAR